MTDLSAKAPQPVSEKEFMLEVELWKSKGHDKPVTVNFDENTNTVFLVVRDYVMPDVSYSITAKADTYYPGA